MTIFYWLFVDHDGVKRSLEDKMDRSFLSKVHTLHPRSFVYIKIAESMRPTPLSNHLFFPEDSPALKKTPSIETLGK